MSATPGLKSKTKAKGARPRGLAPFAVPGTLSKPFIVGLTGNFGTGKSTVAALLKRKGARVLDADRFVRESYRKQSRLYPKLQALFPEMKKRLDRKKIAALIFQDPKKRRRLESLIHPYVFERFQEEIEKMRKGIAILEIPLLFETGFDRRCDATITVGTSLKAVEQRLRRRGFDPAQVRSRWRAQLPIEAKKKRSKFFINNSNGLGATKRQADQVWKQIESLSKGA